MNTSRSIAEKLHNVLAVNDKVLIKPRSDDERTASGLYLPPSVAEASIVRSGYVVKVGPGYPIPAVHDDEVWKERNDRVKYVGLQAQVGDVAIFQQKDAIEIEYEGEKFLIISHHAILLLERDEELFS